jgi:hypothetical protein
MDSGGFEDCGLAEIEGFAREERQRADSPRGEWREERDRPGCNDAAGRQVERRLSEEDEVKECADAKKGKEGGH